MRLALVFVAVATAVNVGLAGDRRRGRSIRDVFGCTSLMIGDGHCDEHCLFNLDDGGDCLREDYCEAFSEDGWCDPVCYDEEYDWDGGDCEECQEGWVGDDTCDIGCNDETRDGGDCVCEQGMVGNDECDVGCMTAEFKWDGGDCYKFKAI